MAPGRFCAKKSLRTKVIRSEVVGVARLELAASWSRTMRATICATPRNSSFIIKATRELVKEYFKEF